MHLSYDPKQNIAYLRLRDRTDVDVETIRVSDEVNVDMTPDGAVYGIELLNANAQMSAADGGRLVLEFAGKRTELPLPEVA
jgi:uncharacterized protein YuzE